MCKEISSFNRIKNWAHRKERDQDDKEEKISMTLLSVMFAGLLAGCAGGQLPQNQQQSSMVQTDGSSTDREAELQAEVDALREEIDALKKEQTDQTQSQTDQSQSGKHKARQDRIQRHRDRLPSLERQTATQLQRDRKQYLP